MHLMPPPHGSSIAVVVPCYNESERLDIPAVKAFLGGCQDVSLLFVDDGSRDDTAVKLAEIAAAFPGRAFALRLQMNCGKAEAVRRGMLNAMDSGFDYIGFWDADLATPLEAIPSFVSVLDRFSEVDVVWGTRLPLFGHHIRRDWNRRLLGRIFSTTSAAAVGVPIRDALCGAKLFRSGDVLRELIGTPFSSRWIFDVELLARLKRRLSSGAQSSLERSLYEFPLESWFEIPGSKVRLKDFVRAAFELMRLTVEYRFGVRFATPARSIAASQVPLVVIESESGSGEVPAKAA